MKNFAKPTAFEIVENHDYNGHHLRIGEVVVIEGVVNPEEENREKRLYQGTWRNTIPIVIPSSKCSFHKDVIPNKEIDDWFDNMSENFIKNEPPPKEYTDITIQMRKRSSYDSVWKKFISFKPDGKDKVTSDDILKLKDELDVLISHREDEEDGSRGESFNLSWVSGINGNIITYAFGTSGGSYDGQYCPTSEIQKYWRFVLKHLNLKEEPPKYTKLKSPQRYGISRFPDYNDMFFIRTDAKIETVNEFYDGSLKKLVKKLREFDFKADLENVDYIIEEGTENIVKTNSIEL